MRGEINVEVKVWRDKEYTDGRWREGTKVGPGVLNRFIGLKPGHHYSRLAFCRPIVPGREDCTVSICPTTTGVPRESSSLLFLDSLKFSSNRSPFFREFS